MINGSHELCFTDSYFLQNRNQCELDRMIMEDKMRFSFVVLKSDKNG